MPSQTAPVDLLQETFGHPAFRPGQEAVGLERVDLVLHQRDQRRYDQGQALEQQRWELVAEALAAAGRQHDQRVAPGQDRPQGARLHGA